MSKKEPAEVEQAPDQATENTTPQDEFAGQGGSYVIDPVTNQRVKKIEE